MYADFHIHSEFSDDSRTPMEKQIERAMELGLREICFTDHVDYGIKKDWTEENIKWRGGDGIGTAKSDLEPLANVNYPEYFGKLLRMRKIYQDRIVIRSGLEFGIQRDTISRYEDLLRAYGEKLDFVLLSIHQVENREFWNGEFMEGKTRKEFYQKYYEELLYTAKHFDGYDVLGHADLISRYDTAGPCPYGEIKDILKEILTVVIQKGKGIEINTSSWHYGISDTTPSQNILKLYHSLGGKIITMGSDAHTPEYIGDHFKDARRVLKEVGFTEVYTYENHIPIAHPL